MGWAVRVGCKGGLYGVGCKGWAGDCSVVG